MSVERWNFNFQRALIDGGLYKVGYGPKLPKIKNFKEGFEQGESIVSFVSGRKIVGLYGCAEVGSCMPLRTLDKCAKSLTWQAYTFYYPVTAAGIVFKGFFGVVETVRSMLEKLTCMT